MWSILCKLFNAIGHIFSAVTNGQTMKQIQVIWSRLTPALYFSKLFCCCCSTTTTTTPTTMASAREIKSLFWRSRNDDLRLCNKNRGKYLTLPLQEVAVCLRRARFCCAAICVFKSECYAVATQMENATVKQPQVGPLQIYFDT